MAPPSLGSLVLVLALGCSSRAASPPPTAPAPVAESAHYRQLVADHGEDNVLVGAVPHDASRLWVSSPADDYAGLPGTTELLERLEPHLEAGGPISTWSEYGSCSEVALVFEPAQLRERPDTLMATLAKLQQFLREPANRQFRIGVFDGGQCGTGTPWTCKDATWSACTLLVYPEAIFLGSRRFTDARDLAPLLPAWLDQLALKDGAMH